MKSLFREIIPLLSNDIYTLFAKKLGIDINGNYYKEIYSIAEANQLIKDSILSNRPCMIARCGTVECQAVFKYLHDKNGFPIGSPILDVLCNNAGFFPNEKLMWYRFGELMLDVMKFADYQGVMYSGGGENYLLKHYAPQAKLIPLMVFDPIYGWTEALENKKVVVVHPFAETIRKQYLTKRTEIFRGTNFLPHFELYTVKAVQTIAGLKDPRFLNWFQALDYMTDAISKVDFDVAIIGCGAYGYPLAARVKQMGKVAIHMGGASQLLFGIMGQRWDNNPRIQRWVNDAWVRPDKCERPENFTNVEGGCYW